MSKVEKLLAKLMSGEADANFAFDQMCQLLVRLGFVRRRGSGSHVIFQDGADFIDLQNARGKVKSYQVRQIRQILEHRDAS